LGQVGEKYDSCYDDDPLDLYGPRIRLARIANPVGKDFPAPDLGEMLAGGATGLDRISRYSLRSRDTIVSLANRATDTLRNAGAAPADQLAAGRQVVSQLNEGFEEVRTQTAQGNANLQIVEDAQAYPQEALAGVARDSARKVRQAVSEHLDPLDELINTVLTTAQDRALNAVGTQAEAAVNRIGQFARTSTTGLYNAMLRRGMGDVPEDAGPAA
jgi:hypothetical protein